MKSGADCSIFACSVAFLLLVFAHFGTWLLYGVSLSSRQDEVFIDGQEKVLYTADETKRGRVLEALGRLQERVAVLEQAKQISFLSLEVSEKLEALKTFDAARRAWHDVGEPKDGQACQMD